MDLATLIATVRNGLGAVRDLLDLAKDMQGQRLAEETNGAVGTTSLEPPRHGIEAPPATRNREVVANRLNRLLALLNEHHRYNSVTIPQIARILELSSVSDLESYFFGEKDAQFALLDQIANTFGLKPDWLQGGHEGQPFAYQIHRLHNHDGGLLGLIEELKPQTIFFVRCPHYFGDAHVAFRLTDWKYEGTADGWHISDHVGATGTRQLYELWQSLNKFGERREPLGIMVGRDLPEGPYYS
jgi:hypothetical protein